LFVGLAALLPDALAGPVDPNQFLNTFACDAVLLR